MGKGDKKTAKGKRIQGSYGKTRKRSKDRAKVTSITDNVEVVDLKEEKTKVTAKKTSTKKSDAAPKKTATTPKKTVAKKAKED